METQKNSLKQADADFPREQGGYSDEISLYDLWNVLVRRLPVFLITAALVIAGGGAYAWLLPLQYEYRSGLELPRVITGGGGGGFEAVVERDVALSDLADLLIPETRRELQSATGQLPPVSVEERGGDYGIALISVAETESRDLVERYHSALADGLAALYKNEFDRALDRYVSRLERQKALLSEHVSVLEGHMGRLLDAIGGSDSGTGLVAAQQVGDLRYRIISMRENLMDLELKIADATQRSHNTEMTFHAVQSARPVGTGKSLILALSVVLGGMLGLFAAFFWEFASNARRLRAASRKNT